MKALRIDPDMGVVEELDRDFEDFREIQKAIDVDCFTVAGYINGNTVFCDDEGLFKINLAFTKMSHYPTPLAGMILVLGSTPDGGSKDVTMTAEELCKEIKFLSTAEVARQYGG